ncbi:MAG: DUF4350 domain-containing protein [Methanobacteriota archaeon]|nr:MAG: DUF4350 domain-containing protein [Euryarchaeota archaeon]
MKYLSILSISFLLIIGGVSIKLPQSNSEIKVNQLPNILLDKTHGSFDFDATNISSVANVVENNLTFTNVLVSTLENSSSYSFEFNTTVQNNFGVSIYFDNDPGFASVKISGSSSLTLYDNNAYAKNYIQSVAMELSPGTYNLTINLGNIAAFELDAGFVQSPYSNLSNYDALIISNPYVGLTQSERDEITSFVANGGGLLLIDEHHVNHDLASIFNIEIFEETIYDPTNNTGVGYEWRPIIYNFTEHPTTEGVSEIAIIAGHVLNVSGYAFPLARGDEDSYSASFPAGTFPIVTAATYYFDGKIVIHNDGSLIDLQSYSNGLFYSNIVQWISNKEPIVYLTTTEYVTETTYQPTTYTITETYTATDVQTITDVSTTTIISNVTKTNDTSSPQAVSSEPNFAMLPALSFFVGIIALVTIIKYRKK